MSITITSYPVETVSGQIQNVLPGFSDIEIIMQRKDVIANPGITPDTISYYDNSGLTDLQVPIYVYNDISVGDYIFVHDKYFYDKPFLVTGKSTAGGLYFLETNEVFYTGMTLADDVIDDVMYINYLQNYYIEARIMQRFVVGTSELTKELVRITDPGTPGGLIKLNLSIANDQNNQLPAIASGLQDESQIKTFVEYRERHDSYTLPTWIPVAGEDVIQGYAIEKPELDKILTLMNYGELYDGYPNIVGLWHSDDNDPGNYIEIGIDYLDINQNIQSSATGESFDDSDFGLMYQDLSSVPSSCEYIRFNVNSEV